MMFLMSYAWAHNQMKIKFKWNLWKHNSQTQILHIDITYEEGSYLCIFYLLIQRKVFLSESIFLKLSFRTKWASCDVRMKSWIYNEDTFNVFLLYKYSFSIFNQPLSVNVVRTNINFLFNTPYIGDTVLSRISNSKVWWKIVMQLCSKF